MGKIIAIEGLDGAGKQTFTENFIKYLKTKNLKVKLMSFPNYKESKFAELAKEMLYSSKIDNSFKQKQLSLLFALDRANSRETINFAKNNHDLVIIDRYITSNLAYSIENNQSKDFDFLAKIEVDYLEIPKPDLQILLNVNPEEASKRANNRSVKENLEADEFEKSKKIQLNSWKNYIDIFNLKMLSNWIKVEWNENSLKKLETIYEPIYIKIID